MNVYNFFRFIGEKRPEYELNSNNDTMISNFRDTFEYDVINDQFYDELGKRESLYMANGDRGHIDDKGRQGEFVKFIATYEKNHMTNKEDDYDFYYQKVTSNFVNNKKDGSEYYHDPNYILTINTERIYDNGKLTQRKDYYILRGEHVKKNEKNSKGENMVHAISYYEDGKEIRREKYWRTEIDGKQVMKSLHYLVPCSPEERGCFNSGDKRLRWVESFFSPEGKRISSEEFTKIQNDVYFDNLKRRRDYGGI